MRVWHFHNYPPISGGGLARYVLDCAQIFIRFDHAVVFSRLDDQYSNDNVVDVWRHGIKMIDLRDFSISMLSSGDLIIFHLTHSPFPEWRIFSKIAQSGCCAVVTALHTEREHTSYNSLSRMRQTIKLRFLRRFYDTLSEYGRVIVFTEYQANQVREVVDVKAVVAPMPIWLEGMTPSRPVAHKVIQPTDILFLGERSIIKGYDRFVRLARASRSVRFVSLGSGTLSARSLVGAGCADCVREVATVSYKVAMDWLRATRFLMSASRTEGWGRAIFEAFLLKIPVLSFDTVGVLRVAPVEAWFRMDSIPFISGDGLTRSELADLTEGLGPSLSLAQEWAYDCNRTAMIAWEQILKYRGEVHV